MTRFCVIDARTHLPALLPSQSDARYQRAAFDQGLPVKLGVLKVNPARRLYERLGFRMVEETEVSYGMAATPPGDRSGPAASDAAPAHQDELPEL